ncbi:hypothetical protein BP6252_11819 [Coleophoma cylindrospora]|uniref:Uncharacterized protein n=1 Tax=Coleophoma cylindrospora TaxID=1849047 RepID=A0A3D8QKN2_9HELO|nr:hypothetical protein BP6252_11819 [Coleophoma cylindrospora]
MSFQDERVLLPRTWHRGPVTLQVNAESRKVAQRYYRKRSGSHDTYYSDASDKIFGRKTDTQEAPGRTAAVAQQAAETNLFTTKYDFYLGGMPCAGRSAILVMWFWAHEGLFTIPEFSCSRKPSSIFTAYAESTAVLIHDFKDCGETFKSSLQRASQSDKFPDHMSGKIGLMLLALLNLEQQGSVVYFSTSLSSSFCERQVNSDTVPFRQPCMEQNSASYQWMLRAMWQDMKGLDRIV